MMENDQQPPPPPPVSRYKWWWWLRVTIYAIFVLTGQAVGTLLLRLYFVKGGNSKWMSTLVQTGGFPIVLPLIFFFPTQKRAPQNNDNHPRVSIVILLYVFLGVLLAANSILFSIGVASLPVSTFSLISASTLAFTAFFSYFLNAQKFTPLIINSLVLLTISSTLLVFQNDDPLGSSTVSKTKYAIGFVCTVSGAAAAGLLVSMTQFGFKRILKLTTFRVILDLIIYESLVATILILIGLFASGEWKTLKEEMERYELGRALYVLTLVGTTLSLEVFMMGATGLVFEVSSLFCNVIGALGVPVVPIFAVVFFHDKINGVKVIAMLLAIWGIASYIYQEYLDDSKSTATEVNNVDVNVNVNMNVNEISLMERA